MIRRPGQEKSPREPGELRAGRQTETEVLDRLLEDFLLVPAVQSGRTGSSSWRTIPQQAYELGHQTGREGPGRTTYLGDPPPAFLWGKEEWTGARGPSVPSASQRSSCRNRKRKHRETNEEPRDSIGETTRATTDTGGGGASLCLQRIPTSGPAHPN